MVNYQPGNIPDSSAPDLAAALRQELQNLAYAFVTQEQFLYLKILNAAPAKPRKGMFVIADGTNWNPGSGEGLYRYTSGGTWKFLG